MKILLVDDHALVRRGVAHVLREDLPDLTIVEKGTAQDAIEAAQAMPWDLVILDINLPDKSGLDALKDIKRVCPDLPVLILSLYPEAHYARRALKADAAGYLTKDTAPEEVTTAVKRILQGGRYVSAALAEQLAADLGTAFGEAHEPHETLSDRELEVLRLIGSGHTPTEVAEQLTLSIKTVSTYRARILEKLNLRTTAELIRFAVDHQLAK
ncbi:response regulator [Nitrospira lenta]|uniref:Transcriptional regulator, LuxR family n=1 Tax=Nitrospira lenta TaxID=1436998 RepID=A0A330L200_9BACT|nr:response regulator transcription factor [Nitrospira lenta]SPP63347.1 Transcriptional regulator, LuxR family [Nitrospira lenta]